MLPRILALDTTLSNQIAAGEVVERPAAALKELLENSLDADARRISVRIEQGGLRLLEVSDDGHGIHPEDLPLSFARHATSKIRRAEDLFAIKSWGFRGEALASLGAVSRLTLSSRRDPFATGREIVCEGAQLETAKEVARPQGTTVKAEELFFNTPARKKFLKSQAAETSAALQVIYRLALSTPAIHWDVSVDGSRVLQLPAVSGQPERVAEVFWEAFKTRVDPAELIALRGEKAELRVRGWMLPQPYMIPTARGIFTFVNGRSVKDKLLHQAILTACREILFGEQYPQLALFLELPPELVDVNVHPTKAEVRFSEPGKVFSLVRSTLEAALAPLRPNLGMSAPFAGTPATSAAGIPASGAPHSTNFSFALSDAPHFHQKPIPGAEAQSVRPQGPQFLGTLKNTYLVCQDAEGLLLVDQHAAHERITYERLRKTRLQEIHSAPMLVPILVEMPQRQLDQLEVHFPALTALGLELDRAGPSQVAIRAVPAMLLGEDNTPRIALGALVRSLGDHLDVSTPETLAEKLQEKILHVLATQSCHSSVRAGQSLSVWEAQALLEQMEATDFSGHCPHGRPTTVRLQWSELERLFKRIV